MRASRSTRAAAAALAARAAASSPSPPPATPIIAAGLAAEGADRAFNHPRGRGHRRGGDVGGGSGGGRLDLPRLLTLGLVLCPCQRSFGGALGVDRLVIFKPKRLQLESARLLPLGCALLGLARRVPLVTRSAKLCHHLPLRLLRLERLCALRLGHACTASDSLRELQVALLQLTVDGLGRREARRRLRRRVRRLLALRR